ncbi:MAG: LacI family DNA-binding transcriptional regulator [Spirochaetales bacterium]|nr:LacI family DNA-binding transcriptional regulator [Spirochaetales bacterium]
MNLTIKDIAQLAGVSKSTVSRVLNDRPDVNASVREKVLKIMSDNNYTPNAQAVAVAKKQSRSIALVIPSEFDHHIINEYYLELIQHLSKLFDDNGFYSLFVYPDSRKSEDLITRRRVDGFVVLSSDRKTSNLMKLIEESDIPCVSTANLKNGHLPCFDIDNRQTGIDATAYLISKGHKDIAYLNFESTLGFEDRLNGYKAALSIAGIEYRDSFVMNSEEATPEGAMESFLQFWKEGNRPSAVFACNDTAAKGLYAAAYRLGIGIPSDLSIISVDNQFSSQYMTPPLTTVNQSLYEKAVFAAEALLECIHTGNNQESKTLSHSIIERGSVKNLVHVDQ